MESDSDSEADTIINFTWVLLIGMRFGFTKKEVEHMYEGKWQDFFESYKTVHDVEMSQRYVPLKEETESTGSLMDL